MQQVAALATRAAAPKIQTVPGKLGCVSVREDGSLEWIAPDEPNIYHQMLSPDQVFAYAKGYTEGSLLFLDGDSLALVIDAGVGEQRRHRVTCKLKPTPAWAALRRDNVPWMDHKPFVRDLRTTFADVVPAEWLAAVRSVKFSSKTDAERADVPGQSASSYSRADLMVGLDGKGIAEDLTLTVQPFSNVDHSEFVHCILDLDRENQKFRLVAIQDSMEKALRSTLESIAKLRTEEHPKLYFGTP